MSKTRIIDIQNDRFPTVKVRPGTHVIWRNLDPRTHSAETLRANPDYFNAGPMLPGDTSSPILFGKVGKVKYYCRFHTDMIGEVEVTNDADGGDHDHAGHDHGDHDHGDHDHGGHGLHHLHGFVTGGRSGNKIYMSHTPVLADKRHSYQVILEAHFVEPAHAKIYSDLRQSAYGDGVVQVFHEHMSMPDIGTGVTKLLPKSEVAFYPSNDKHVPGMQQPVPGLEENIPIAIDHVIHFHPFDTEADRPDALTYLMYGDDQDIFIDHYMERAPSFHTVARLRSAPAGWTGGTHQPSQFSVPGRKIRDLPPRIIERMSIVDNGFHVMWMLPPGVHPTQAQDPLLIRGTSDADAHVHNIVWQTGEASQIAIERFLHLDTRLLNYGVFIV